MEAKSVLEEFRQRRKMLENLQINTAKPRIKGMWEFLQSKNETINIISKIPPIGHLIKKAGPYRPVETETDDEIFGVGFYIMEECSKTNRRFTEIINNLGIISKDEKSIRQNYVNNAKTGFIDPTLDFIEEKLEEMGEKNFPYWDVGNKAIKIEPVNVTDAHGIQGIEGEGKFGDGWKKEGWPGKDGTSENGETDGEDKDWLEKEVVKQEERDNLKFALETKSIMKVAIQLAVKEGENDWKLTTREILIAIAYYGKRKEKEYKTAQFVLEKLRSNRSDYLKDYFNRIDRKTSIDKKNREKVLKRTGYVGDTLREAKSIAIRTTDKNLIQIRHLLASLLFFRAAGKETPGAHNVVKEAGIEFPTFIREFQQYVKNTFKEDNTEAWENIFGENVAFEEQSVKENVKVEGSATVEVIDRIKIRGMSVAEHGLGDRITDKDKLGFRPYVEVVARFLTHEETELPLTLSVEGEWGSGKSSFMLQLKNEIGRIYKDKGEEKAFIVEFDPWRHDKDEALWAAFALEFIRQASVRLGFWRRVQRNWELRCQRFDVKEGWADLAKAVILSIVWILVTVVIVFGLWTSATIREDGSMEIPVRLGAVTVGFGMADIRESERLSG